MSDIIGGKAVRDIKKGEKPVIDFTELSKLKVIPIVTVSKEHRSCLIEAIEFYQEACLRNVSGSVIKCEELLECLRFMDARDV